MNINSIKTLEDNKERSQELLALIKSNVETKETIITEVIQPIKEITKRSFIKKIIKDFEKHFTNNDFQIYRNMVIGVGKEYIAFYKNFAISILINNDNIDMFELYLYRDKNKKKVFKHIEIICESEIDPALVSHKNLHNTRFTDISQLDDLLIKSENDLADFKKQIRSKGLSMTPKIKITTSPNSSKDIYYNDILDVIESID